MQNALFTLAADDPSQHVYNHKFITKPIESPDFMVKWFGSPEHVDMWLWSGNQGNLILSGILLILLGLFVANKIKTGAASEGTDRYVTKNKFAHMVEVICVYLREEVARPLLGERTNSLMPFLWTIFFFILVNNLLGLIPLLDIVHLASSDLKKAHATPIGGTATQNIWVTAVLAIIACVFFNGVAIKRLGVGGYFAHLTAGAPFPASILIFVLELASQLLIKPFALALRLFANMTAGHILLATLFGFAGMVATKGFIIKGPVTLIAILGGTGIMFLELFVAFMQAFVFMFLVTVFIALMDHHDHDHEHEHGHAHGHEHAHA
ncbi:MAG: F0F1 ATP synthase subunit A [Phycisphaerae bacterium]|jgi:F-type H+-transporting ATPase subunit a